MNTFIQKSTVMFVFALATLIANAQTTVGKSFSGVKVITINTTSGNVILDKSSTNLVNVKVAFTLEKKNYQPVFEQSDSTVLLKENGFKRSEESGSTWYVSVPDGVDVQYSSGVGDLEVSNLKLTISASSVSGNYVWKNVTGNSSITTTAGDIEIENYQGNITINGRSGNVSISKCKGDLHVTTGPGDVTFEEVIGGISVNTGSGSIEAERITLTSKSAFNSVAGDAILELSAPVTNDLSVSSVSGVSILNCNGNKLKGKLVMMANKKHGEIKSPFAFEKTEDLKEEDGRERIRKTAQLDPLNYVISISTGSGKAIVKK